MTNFHDVSAHTKNYIFTYESIIRDNISASYRGFKKDIKYVLSKKVLMNLGSLCLREP